jgi:hypothetical protein
MIGMEVTAIRPILESKSQFAAREVFQLGDRRGSMHGKGSNNGEIRETWRIMETWRDKGEYDKK